MAPAGHAVVQRRPHEQRDIWQASSVNRWFLTERLVPARRFNVGASIQRAAAWPCSTLADDLGTNRSLRYR
jgi:hypothetical protein